MQEPQKRSPDTVGLFSLYKLFFVVGLFSFGGGLTAWFHREVVLVRGWMTDEEFFSGYSLAQILPGVNSTNMALYIGQHVRGALGSAVALIALLTGPFVVVLAVAAAYHQLTEIPGFAPAMAGIAAAAVGMMIRLGLTSMRSTGRRAAPVVVLAATFVAVGVLQWPLVPVVLVIAPLSIAAAWPRKPKDA